jgi:2-dehydro-3-deoxy-D-arabinonate dehydratase
MNTPQENEPASGLVRFRDRDGRIGVGVRSGDHIHPVAAESIAQLLTYRADRLRAAVESALAAPALISADEVSFLAPVDGRTEVWGAGVTYLRSRAARAEESSYERVYVEVYEAERPELFFKAQSWQVLTNGDVAGIRADCSDSVAEPELALVVNAHAEIVGALVCNDLTARGIEAINPIYLPQAKLFTGSCAVSSTIVPWWLLRHPEDLAITMTVERAGSVAFSGECRTASMTRSYSELIEWLFKGLRFLDGAILSTGTGIVPELGDGLCSGDIVTITVEQVGTLVNPIA